MKTYTQTYTEALCRLTTGLNAAGWMVTKVYDDEGPIEADKAGMAPEKVAEAALAVDLCRLAVRKGDARHSILIVLGNGAEEIVADHGYTEGDPDGFSALMDDLCDQLGNLCPRCGTEGLAAKGMAAEIETHYMLCEHCQHQWGHS